MKRFIHYVSHSVAAMIGISVYILADTFFIASYSGRDGLAVLNLALPLYGMMNALGSMLGIGSATRYSIRKARGKDVNSFFLQALFWNAVFSIPFLIGGLPEADFTAFGSGPGASGLGNPLCSDDSPFCFLLYGQLYHRSLCAKRQQSIQCYDWFCHRESF